MLRVPTLSANIPELRGFLTQASNVDVPNNVHQLFALIRQSMPKGLMPDISTQHTIIYSFNDQNLN